MLRLVMRGMRTTMSGMSGAIHCRTVCRREGTRLALADQGHEIRFKTLTIFGRMAQQQINQPALAGTEVPVHTAPRQAMQEGHRLLKQELFEFVSGHVLAISYGHSAVS